MQKKACLLLSYMSLHINNFLKMKLVINVIIFSFFYYYLYKNV